MVKGSIGCQKQRPSVLLNDMDRFHLVQDVLDRVPQLGDEIAYLKQEMQGQIDPAQTIYP